MHVLRTWIHYKCDSSRSCVYVCACMLCDGVYNMYRGKGLEENLIISVRLRQLILNNEVLRDDNVIFKEWFRKCYWDLV